MSIPLSRALSRRRSRIRRVPWTLMVFLLVLPMPWVGSRYDTFLATQIVIDALFAVSLNLLLGTTGSGVVRARRLFRHRRLCLRHPDEDLRCAVRRSPFPAAGLGAAAFSLVFGFFCVRLTKIYFAMLTLAFSQIVWAVCFKWNAVTGGDQGIADVPFPEPALDGGHPRCRRSYRNGRFYLLTLTLVALSIAAIGQITRSPFGRMLTAIRDNRERAAFIGLNVRAYELAGLRRGGRVSPGWPARCTASSRRGVFPDYVFWPKSAEVMIMAILGGMNSSGDRRSARWSLVWLNQEITNYTQYWPFVLGTMLLVLLFAFAGRRGGRPGLYRLLRRLQARACAGRRDA